MNGKKSVLAAGLAWFALFAGCASGPSIRSDRDPSADFSSYRTYDFADELGTDRAGYSTLITTHFKRATARELEARGYRRVDEDADVLVNFYVSVREKTDVRSTQAPVIGVGYYGYRRGLYTAWPAYPTDVRTVHYKTGTANVDVIDAKRRQLVWEGVAEGRISDEAMQNPGAAIDSVVRELFERYPSRAGTAATKSR